ncbi:hypothetical protein DPMN_104755 [Dreissena polymorpha]|uniref:Uncharacterized protein n=1 Tax=Dreissena polymorpha TaxID=45954 RepID=A0A9D4K2V6_DREPO|nr:hypothetical protein DPMN_104755 [Dreissena polymorpha]
MTHLLTKFHEDRTINVASRVFTNKCGRTDGGQRPVTKAHLSNQLAQTDRPTDQQTRQKQYVPHYYNGQTDGRTETKVLTKFHENWAKNVTSRKNAPPTGGHVFSPIWNISELVREINKTNVLTNFHDDWAKIVTSRVFTRKTAPPTGGHLHEHWASNVTSTVFELDRDFIGAKLLTKFHEARTINVASRKDGRTYDGQRPVTKAHLSYQVC